MARLLLALLVVSAFACTALSAPLTCADVWSRCGSFCKPNGGLKRAECNDDGGYACNCNAATTDSSCPAETATCTAHCGGTSNQNTRSSVCSGRFYRAYVNCDCRGNPVLSAGKTYTLPGGSPTTAVAACKAACGTAAVTVCLEKAERRYEVDEVDCRCGYSQAYASRSGDKVCYGS